MRTDTRLDRDFRFSGSWLKDELTGREGPQVDRYSLPPTEGVKNSLSGKERNKLFLSQNAEIFHDLSAVSGVDSIKDGRSFATWDYDRDGLQDIVLTNINAPVLNLFRNNLGSLVAGRANMLAVRCVGGNKSAQPTSEFSSRDGTGARVFVQIGDRTLFRELHCGEGLAAQNSSTLIFGLGSASHADSIIVKWPGGREQTIGVVAENSLVTVYEDPAEFEAGFAIEEYRKNIDTEQLAVNRKPLPQLPVDMGSPASSELVMYVSMATWCQSCREHLPELARLRDQFESDQLAMLGVPIDLEDTDDKLIQYQSALNPAYRILTELEEQTRTRYFEYVLSKTRSDALPSTVITNIHGEVLSVSLGIPTVSELRKLLESLAQR